MIDKQKYLNGITFDKTSSTEPCTEPFTHAINNGYEMIVLNPGKRVFHLNAGFQQTYGDLIVNEYWKRNFDIWKTNFKSNENLEDYINDDGMDIIDLAQLNNYTSSLIEHWAKDGGAYSFLNLSDIDFKYIEMYYSNLLDEKDKKLVIELLDYIKEATFLSNPRLYKNFFDGSFNLEVVQSKYFALYTKLNCKLTGKDYKNRFVLPIQNYMCLSENFDISFYDIVKNKSVVYIGPYDAIKELNEKRNLKMGQYEYYLLSEANAYNDMEKFFDQSNSKNYQLVIISGDFYGNIIAGRVKRLNKMAFNIGDALFFNLNDNLKTIFEITQNKTAYKLKDNYKHYGLRNYEKYLI